MGCKNSFDHVLLKRNGMLNVGFNIELHLALYQLYIKEIVNPSMIVIIFNIELVQVLVSSLTEFHIFLLPLTDLYMQLFNILTVM